MDSALTSQPEHKPQTGDAELVAAARGDPQAFAALYHRYVTPVYRYLYHRVGNPAEAEDLTSQVFTAALESLDGYRERGNFPAWLFTIARRTAIAHYRRRRPEIPLEEGENSGEGGDPLEGLVRDESVARLGALLAGLDEEQRELLDLRFSAALTYKQIAQVLGRSEGAVKMAVHRLLNQLENDWSQLENDWDKSQP